MGSCFNAATGDAGTFGDAGKDFAGPAPCSVSPPAVEDELLANETGVGFGLNKLCPNTVIPYTKIASSTTTPVMPVIRIHLPLELGDGACESGVVWRGGWPCCGVISVLIFENELEVYPRPNLCVNRNGHIVPIRFAPISTFQGART